MCLEQTFSLLLLVTVRAARCHIIHVQSNGLTLSNVMHSVCKGTIYYHIIMSSLHLFYGVHYEHYISLDVQHPTVHVDKSLTHTDNTSLLTLNDFMSQ